MVNPTAKQVRKREAAFGTPIAETRIGNLLIDVYPYDIAPMPGKESGPDGLASCHQAAVGAQASRVCEPTGREQFNDRCRDS